ncbi:MAG: TonB family protein [Pseudomonadota bacterium]|nr:TonB family protein [Pseudomonadota bacterium]
MTRTADHSTSPHLSPAGSSASRTRAPGPRVRLDGERIAASASAIAAHVVVLMLVLVPVAAPQLIPGITDTEVIWVPREPRPLIEPIPVPVTAPPAATQPRTPAQAQPVDPPVQIAEAEPGDIAAVIQTPPAQTIGTTGPIDSIALPQTGMQLQYASAPPPAYPRDALREGLGGTVLLQVLVDTDGKPLQVDVARSSGHRSLDRAARRHVLARWMFRPAIQDGRPVQAIGLVPVEFALRQ